MATSTLYIGKSITDVLATELLVLVCGSLPREDLTNFRLANKVCAEVASKNLVQDLHVIFTRKSLSNLLNISKQPNLSKHVRSILYEPRTLRTICMDTYASYIADQLRPMHPFNQKDLDKGYELILEYVKYDIVVFAQAVPKFSTLNKIVVDDAGLPSDQVMNSYNCKAYLRKKMFSSGSSPSYSSHKSEMLHGLLHAASLAGIKLTTLRVTALPLPFFNATQISSNDVTFSALQNIQHIDITIKARKEEWEARVKIVVPRLANFLNFFSNLESLRIDLGEPQTKPKFSILLDPVFGSTGNFPKLRSLDLRHFSCTKDFFSEFLQKHAGTLEHLKLDTMTMASNCPGWGNVFNTLETDLKLKSCYFTGDWHEGWGIEEGPTYPIKLSTSYTGTRPSSLGEVLQYRVVKKCMPGGGVCITMDEIWAAATRESQQRGRETERDDSAEDSDSEDYEDLLDFEDLGHYIDDDGEDDDEDDEEHSDDEDVEDSID
ncbi:uncharacterized protein EAF02_005228 [Botrytis sinoallii]|uniref:uncharacterized protein n=1 Tax=Botrytis sinoallii TaxID=1463999 RepID=UPI0019021515|nr:uncharacterized protein EAF02_005228 [Botrytis sinoallii]KAF7883308.1 hypothetical protein EAF02_005228 [Botrytis sinoallii]